MANPIGPTESLGNGDIDKLVPPNIMRLTQHLHNLIYIRYFYESIGQQPPPWVKGEMARAETSLLSQLDREHAQGGVFRKEKEQCDKDEQVKMVEPPGKSSLSLKRLARRV
jgi:hypothetical protein